MSAPTTQARERPILFSGPMVRAILDGQKTQTRRVVKPQPAESPWSQCTKCGQSAHTCACSFSTDRHADRCTRLVAAGPPDVERCPYGAPGDRLWVREAWADSADASPLAFDRGTSWPQYRATCDDALVTHWRSPIHMPRWACRIVLELTDVRVERLWRITEPREFDTASSPDIRAEGFERVQYRGYASSRAEDPGDFSDAWDARNARRGFPWKSNPWVWVLTFRRSEP